MVPISGKVEWKSTSLEHGALLLTLIGPVMMHKLSVTSWGISNQVPKLILKLLLNTGDHTEGDFLPSYSIQSSYTSDDDVTNSTSLPCKLPHKFCLYIYTEIQ